MQAATSPLAITALYAVPLALLFLVLSVRVIVLRRRHRVGFRSGGDPELERRARVHANFAEYAPFALLLLAMAEIKGTPGIWLHAVGMLLLAGRLAHAVGVSRAGTDDLGRVAGMAGSQTAILLAALLLLW